MSCTHPVIYTENGVSHCHVCGAMIDPAPPEEPTAPPEEPTAPPEEPTAPPEKKTGKKK